ncbi:MAG: histidine phosphatase family protein [Magnetococcales bacterium]|nr:histidine phosphatase family protein [Magnetococcales bacterium]
MKYFRYSCSCFVAGLRECSINIGFVFSLFSACLMISAVEIHAEDAGKLLNFEEKIATIENVKALRQGGFVLYMRHGTTDTSIPDRVPHVDLNDCTTQRPLTEEGRQLAASVGQEIRRHGIPVGDVLVSPMCRTRQTAEAAFGKDFVVNAGLMYTANLTSEEKVQRKEITHRLLSTPLSSGTNRVIVAHAPNMMDAAGYFPKPEGIVVIFRPMGEKGFEYIASIPPARWQELK